MYAGKPIIGLVGGIGSGKSFVARLFAEMGCMVIDSDQQVREAYRDPGVIDTIRDWWGDDAVTPAGGVNKSAIAARIFSDPAERTRLEGLLHPIVHEARRRQMEAGGSDAQVLAYVWDTPLLLEAELAGQCEAVVYIDAPFDQRLARVRARSDWDREELLRREKSQMPLDTKRELSDYMISNAADAGSGALAPSDLREQVRRVLSQILAESTHPPEPQ